VLSVLRFTDSDYPCGIFKFFSINDGNFVFILCVVFASFFVTGMFHRGCLFSMDCDFVVRFPIINEFLKNLYSK